MSVEDFGFGGEDELSLLETLDHVLDSGLVIAGEVTISVANIDLIYVGLNVLLGSVDTIQDVLSERLGGEDATTHRALWSSGNEADATRED
jgi:hypothetical protein